MAKRLSLSLSLLAALISPAAGQFDNWNEHQINTSICTWTEPRAALIRDTIYLDGGTAYWAARLDNGEISTGDSSQFGGNILTFNLSNSFSPDTNITELLFKNLISKTLGGRQDNSIATPNYEDGAMLANDSEFYLYGGLTSNNTDISSAPAKNDVLKYEAFQYGPNKPTWSKGIIDSNSGDDVNHYIAYGGAASAPSENKAWYFSGMGAPSHGPIYIGKAVKDVIPTKVSNRLIEVDFADQRYEKWSNSSLSKDVEGRANPELVWVPVGKQGILVVIGGVVFPEWAGVKTHKSDDGDKSKSKSPEFMKTIDVYDVASKKWYKQKTSGDGPGARTRGCAVVTYPDDKSSYNIYYYGGFDGINVSDAFDDTVWVLSLPSFAWIKLNEGKTGHGRAGHKCFLPYPDQMMVFGGYRELSGPSITCLDGGPIVMFNVSNGEWMDSYDPTKYNSAYSVPKKVQDVIKGGASGGAELKEPDGGWDSDDLGEIFGTKYDMDKITKHWPYMPAAESSRPNLPQDGDKKDKGGDSGLPKWVAPVLGVVLGLILLTGLIILFCLWRRRKIFKNRKSDDSSEDAGNRIISWIKGQPSEKARTLSTSEYTAPTSETVETRNATSPQSFYETFSRHEMADTQVAELGDTSPPAELHDTGLSPIDIIQKHSRFGRTRSQRTSEPSKSSFSGTAAEFASIVSSPSGEDTGPSGTPRMDSPAIATAPLTVNSQEKTRNTEDGEKATGNEPEQEALIRESAISPTPVSPPTADDEGDEYWSRKDMVSPLRKSVFIENNMDNDNEKST